VLLKIAQHLVGIETRRFNQAQTERLTKIASQLGSDGNDEQNSKVNVPLLD